MQEIEQRIYLAATYDTKGEEAEYLRQLLRRDGVMVVTVDDGDILGGQLGHAGSHQPGHRRHLGIAQAAARVQVEQHRGGRGLSTGDPAVMR